MGDGASDTRGRKRGTRVPLAELRGDPDALLTYEQVAEWLQCSERDVYRRIKEGLPIRRFGWQPRVRVGDLRQWIQQTPIAGA